MTAINTQTKNFKPNPDFKRKDLYQEVTDVIVDQLEKGTVPWLKPWVGGNELAFGIPQNLTTGKNYRGINILLLWAAAEKQGFGTNDWATFKQWREVKKTIREGEKGTMIVYYDTFEREEEGEIKKIPFLKHSYVFNRSQLASYDPTKLEIRPSESSLVERIDALDEFVMNANATIDMNSTMAAYDRNSDKIKMPDPASFIDTENCSSTEGFYASLSHELTHWTGHASRLDRNFGKKFGDKDYAVEELVAELGAAFICTEFGIARPTKDNYAAYIASWLQIMKENKYAVITAASEASKASEFLHKLQPQ